jgi:hypothetical protein
MKKALFILAFLLVSMTTLLAQAPPPPPPDATNGGANGAVGGPLGAPIDSGLAVFLMFAAGYTAWHWKMRKPQADSNLSMK